MRIEVFNAVGGAAFFEAIMREWQRDGDRVTSLSTVTDADYRAQRGLLNRLSVRWRMYGGYARRCWTVAAGQSAADVRVVTTNPFFGPALAVRAGRAGKPRVPTVNLVYDLFPEALVQAGRMEADSWLARRCAAITRHALREADATVFLGERLRVHAEAAHGRARRAVVIPVGADGSPFAGCAPERPAQGEIPVVFYAGLMGRMHDTATLLALWKDRPRVEGLRWMFHAAGLGYGQLQREAGLRPEISWGGPLGDAEWREKMRRVPVALVTIAPGAERIVMPSKTYSALVAGQAVLAVCPRESDLAELVAKHDCGWVVEPGDVAGLHRVLRRIGSDPEEVYRKRCQAYAAGHRCYAARPVADRWKNLLLDLTEPFRRPSNLIPAHEATV